MKNLLFILMVSAFIAATMLTGCQTNAEKVNNAEQALQEANEDVLDARQNLDQTLQDSIADYQLFKKESDEKIRAQEKSIADFKARIATEKQENKAEYQKKLAKLEQKNSDLKMKLENYKDNGMNNWEKFKTEFNRDMNELGKALKDLTVDNSK